MAAKAKRVGMSKGELRLAQYLYSVYEDSLRFADWLDPNRTRDKDVVRDLDALVSVARDAFVRLTGRLASVVMLGGGLVELNTRNPAAWTQLPYEQRMRAP